MATLQASNTNSMVTLMQLLEYLLTPYVLDLRVWEENALNIAS